MFIVHCSSLAAEQWGITMDGASDPLTVYKPWRMNLKHYMIPLEVYPRAEEDHTRILMLLLEQWRFILEL
jgi:hypothetical protein